MSPGPRTSPSRYTPAAQRSSSRPVTPASTNPYRQRPSSRPPARRQAPTRNSANTSRSTNTPVEWDRVPGPRQPRLQRPRRRRQQRRIHGLPSGHALLPAAPQEPSFVLNPAGPCAWKTTVTLKQRAIVVADGNNAGTYGWNDWFNPKTKQWEPLTLTNGEPPYNAVEFSGMFS